MYALLVACSVLFAIGVISEPINVHIVCHTHDDVGWLKTVDEYFMGANNSIQQAGVQYIFDSVVPALEENPARKFVYVEIAYFMRWWREQTPSMQNRLRKLVNSGQLEFINAGWCMNDEAGTHYVDMIDQMTLGSLYVKDKLGIVPTVGWHIDPFGHSSQQASLFGQMGFDGWFFARLDYDDRMKRLLNKEMEMIWRSSPSLPENAIFTGALYDGYGPPPGFCWDIDCADPPIQNDPDLEDYNLDERAEVFAQYCAQQNSNYTSNNIMLTMGSDFQYNNANTWYKNLDKLMTYLQANVQKYNLNIFYSTPTIYLRMLNQKNLTWTVKTDDFFPYADIPSAYWTGYMSSRPSIKGYVRRNSGYLQFCRQVDLFTAGRRTNPSTSEPLTEAMGVAQHHDAVAGTEKQHVAYDYAKRISIGHVACENLTNDGIGVMVSGMSGKLQFTQCELMNVTICPATQSSNNLAMVLYNMQGTEVMYYQRLPINSSNVQVVDNNGKPVESQIVLEPATIRPGAAQTTLVFKAGAPALGFNTYFLQPAGGDREVPARDLTAEEHEAKTGGLWIENSNLRLTFDPITGRTSSLLVKSSGAEIAFDQVIAFYNSSAGNTNVNSSQPGGAYIFRPNRTETFPASMEQNYSAVLTFGSNGSLVQEARQVFSDWASQSVRLYHDANFIEFEYTIGPIEIADDMGKEVITQYFTNLASDAQWYTDSNGREMIWRKRNYRATWNLNCTTPVSCDYAPVNAAIYLRDQSRGLQLTVVTDRSEGGASTTDGQLELLLHRRLLHDDYRGVGECLNETGITGKGLIIRVRHLVFIDTFENSINRQRNLQNHELFPAVAAFAPMGANTPASWNRSFVTTTSFLANQLPQQIQMMTLQPMTADTAILRLAHIFAANESMTYSRPVTVNLGSLFGAITVDKADELALQGNQLLSNINRMSWKTDDGKPWLPHDPPLAPGSLIVTLKPMQIRTFLIHYKKAHAPQRRARFDSEIGVTE